MTKDGIAEVFMFVLGMCFLYNFSYGQTYYEFIGTVVDENNNPLIGAYVAIQTVNKGDVTDANGNFIIDKLSGDKYDVEISFLGYETLTEIIYLVENKKYTFQFSLVDVFFNCG